MDSVEWLSIIGACIGSLGGAAWLIAAAQEPGFKMPHLLAVPYTVALFGGMIWPVIVFYACVYMTLGVVDGGTKDVRDVSTCLYLSMITWTTIGYGDVVPSHQARFWAASEGIAGYFLMILFIAALTNMWGGAEKKMFDARLGKWRVPARSANLSGHGVLAPFHSGWSVLKGGGGPFW
jgi:Ion channel